MVRLWTLSHRCSLNSDFISLHHHQLHSWAVVQLPGQSHNTRKYELKAAAPQDRGEFADTLSQCEARGPSHHRWEKEIGGPSRPPVYYPLRPLLEHGSHIHAYDTRAHTHIHTLTHTDLNHFTCPLHSTCCKVKDVFGCYENKISKLLQIPCH